MIARLLGAVQFLTTFPIRGSTASAGASAMFFPLVGAAVGLFGALVLVALQNIFPWTICSLLVIALWALLTGGLHEDGFADVADAFRAGRPRERILAILKDSRIGAHGALALVLITLVRWQALAGISADPMYALPGIFAVSRAAMVALAWISAPAGGGLGFQFAQTLTSLGALIAIASGMLFAAGTAAGPLLVWGAGILVVVMRLYFINRIGGVTGDCLGATSLMVETWGLVLFTCQRCM